MRQYGLLIVVIWTSVAVGAIADEPPALNPFAPRKEIRDDAVPGYVELSSGAVFPGQLHLTRDMRLKIYDQQLERQREIPWSRIRQVECHVEREWLEKEWRFRENANDQKVFTGRLYPARIYMHTVTLTDGRKIHGPLSAIIYVQQPGKASRKFVLHKRDKGKPGYELKSLPFVRKIRLGEGAKVEGDSIVAKGEAGRTSAGKD